MSSHHEFVNCFKPQKQSFSVCSDRKHVYAYCVLYHLKHHSSSQLFKIECFHLLRYKALQNCRKVVMKTNNTDFSSHQKLSNCQDLTLNVNPPLLLVFSFLQKFWLNPMNRHYSSMYCKTFCLTVSPKYFNSQYPAWLFLEMKVPYLLITVFKRSNFWLPHYLSFKCFFEHHILFTL